MVMMNIEILSRERIKPSSPTPHHLRNLKLSSLDQLAPPIYVPIVLFYHAQCNLGTDNHFKQSSLLKKSLAKCLTCFYPLAGTINDQSSAVDCNDEGVDYLEALVHCKLSHATEMANMNVLSQLLPFEAYNGSEKEVLLAVQFNIFECGGVAIGVCISHKIADGTSLITFVNAWAALSRGSNDQIGHHSFDAAMHFPPKDASELTRKIGFSCNIGIMKEKVVTKRFVFDKLSIAALRDRASSAEVKNPTRVEAVSAFIWRRFMAMTRTRQGHATVCAALHAVNLRERMEPPLPSHSFGNLWRVAIAPMMVNDNEIDMHVLVRQLRQAIRGINGDYVKKLQSGDGGVETMRRSCDEFSKGKTEFLNFTSWCRFRWYEVDFEWGKPTWVCSPMRHYKNVIILMSTNDEGIEAWVNMLEEEMAMFESDSELLPFVSSTFGD
ncbi:stemmadenine O-acetyltransferase-like [Cornus florida]|uniref:stemmadenine O-acetyltransferase-like n=1 Tax=Cornus florida TaxID=4283 RepID=UPI0028976C52|nr:stemmadenine O-acetyltransferase-like [Cornus florida]